MNRPALIALVLVSAVTALPLMFLNGNGGLRNTHIIGTVINASGKPCSGATARLVHRPYYGGSVRSRSTIVDQHGRFSVAVVHGHGPAEIYVAVMRGDKELGRKVSESVRNPVVGLTIVCPCE